jgi:hypothetical protein
MTEPTTIQNLWGTFTTTKDNQITFKPQLKTSIPKICNPIYSAWVTLCYDMVNTSDGSLEVQTIILLNKKTGEWKFAIPRQKVSMGSVKDANLADCIDIITGERYLNHDYNSLGYRMIGTAHSHGTMGEQLS